MYTLVIKVFHRRFNGDKSFHLENLTVTKTQLDNWLARGNTEDVEIVRYYWAWIKALF